MGCCAKRKPLKKDIFFALFSVLVFIGMHARFALLFLLFPPHKNRIKLAIFYLKSLKHSVFEIIRKNSFFNSRFFSLCVFTFPSVSVAMHAERLIKKENINTLLIPVPNNISSECGSAVCVNIEHRDQILVLFEKNNIPYGIQEIESL